MIIIIHISLSLYIYIHIRMAFPDMRTSLLIWSSVRGSTLLRYILASTLSGGHLLAVASLYH